MTVLTRRHFAGRTLALAAWPAMQATPLAQAQAQGEQAEDAALRAAIAAPHRSEANRRRDSARHPYETLRFFGLAPQQRVLELAPGGGWYTEILAPYLQAQGQLLLAAEAADDPDDYRRRGRRALDDKLARNPELYGRVTVGLLPRAARSADAARTAPAADGLGPAGRLDLVLTFRNVHNWLEAGHLDHTLQAVQTLLRPGGVLGVVEHRAPPGRSTTWIEQNGYVPEDLVIERARAAGLRLDARSEVNANPRDGREHPHGVWSLPPTLRGGDVDRDRFVAIGESDRFTHRYVKR